MRSGGKGLGYKGECLQVLWKRLSQSAASALIPKSSPLFVISMTVILSSHRISLD